MLSDITSREVDAVREFSDFLITQDGATLGGDILVQKAYYVKVCLKLLGFRQSVAVIYHVWLRSL